MNIARSQIGIRAWRLVPVVCALLFPVGVAARPRSAVEADAQRYYRLGQTQFEQGMTLQAIESLKKAIDMNPKLAEAHNYLGIIYLQQTDPSRAAKYLKKAVEINPYYTDAHNTLGVAYKEMGKYDRALAEFETALKDRTYATPEKIHLNMGHLYLAQGDYPQAIHSFEQALTIRPDYLRGMLGLGLAYQKSGRTELATRKFQEVVKLHPDSAEAAEARQLLGGQGKREGS